jgi:acyl-[acyl-carrier-protein]-phospholipid O-acyltransferase/long-chain-fatty-acid--[acyl-carrier-protein] ligase
LTITANPWTSTIALLREFRIERRLWSGAHIVSWFWVVGFVALSLLPTLIKSVIGGSEGVVTLCLTVFTVGIALGSVLAARASRGEPNLSLVPLGALLMGCFSLLIAWIAFATEPSPATVRPLAFATSGSGVALIGALLGLAVAGGLYIVPAFAAVQAWAPADKRARVIASVNILNAGYMLTAGAIVAALQLAGATVGLLFAALAVLCFGWIAIIVRAWGNDVAQSGGRLFPWSAPAAAGRPK